MARISFGEEHLTAGMGTRCGRFRVQGVQASRAAYPRLDFDLGVQLSNVRNQEGGALLDFELRDLLGEVRLERDGTSLVMAEKRFSAPTWTRDPE